MRELGIDLSRRVPRKLVQEDAEWAHVVVTMGCAHLPESPVKACRPACRAGASTRTARRVGRKGWSSAAAVVGVARATSARVRATDFVIAPLSFCGRVRAVVLIL